MSTRHPLRLAALAALATLAASGIRATEATLWNPRDDVAPAVSLRNDAMLQPGAWTVGRGDATQFHDAVARDTASSRAAVREELAQAHRRGLVADTGEAGATERVWARRATYVSSGRDRELAVQASADPIGAIAARETPALVDHGAMYALAPDETPLRLPSNQTPDGPALAIAPIAASAPVAGETRHEDIRIAEGPRARDDSLTVPVR